MVKVSSLKGTTTIKPNGSKNTKPLSLTRTSKFNCAVSMQCFQCLTCISLHPEHHHSLESKTPCFWSHWLAFYSFVMFHNKQNRNELVYMLKAEWQEYNCLNSPSHDCRRTSRRKLLFSVISLNVVQLCSNWQTDVWKSMVYFVSLSIKCHSWDTPWRICGLGFFFRFLVVNVFIDATIGSLIRKKVREKKGNLKRGAELWT